MNPWLGKGAVILGIVLSVAIRWPHEGRSKTVAVAESRRGALEVALLALVMFGFLVLPVVSFTTSLLAFADVPLHPVAFGAGLALLAFALWLFHRSHVDLGTNWSATLELREGHSLVTTGVYSRIRHPMYTALFSHMIAQALLLPNLVAGPAALVAFTIMFVLRLGPEEAMMRARFGEAYDAYARRAKRLIPGVF